MQIKTYLLCKWGQVVAGGGGMIAAPTDAQWTWTDAGGARAAASIVGGSCPIGADGFQLGAVVSPGIPTSNIIGTAACNATQTAQFTFGDTALAQIRWTLGGVAVSGWSSEKSLAIVLDPVVQTYIINLAILRAGFAGVPFLDTTTINALDKFVKGCKSDGIWIKMIEVNCVLWINGGANNVMLAMAPLLIGPQGEPVLGVAWTNANFIEANATINGLVGVPASITRAITAIQPANTFKSQNNAGISMYVSQWTATLNTIEMGMFDPDGLKALFLVTNDSANKFEGGMWYNGTVNILVPTTGLAGYYSLNRLTSTDLKAYFANSGNAFAQIGSSAVASTAIPNTNHVNIWACASPADSGISFTDRRVSYISFHDGFTAAESQLEFNRVQQLRIDLNGGSV